jgi:hypothetical protein
VKIKTFKIKSGDNNYKSNYCKINKIIKNKVKLKKKMKSKFSTRKKVIKMKKMKKNKNKKMEKEKNLIMMMNNLKELLKKYLIMQQHIYKKYGEDILPEN